MTPLRLHFLDVGCGDSTVVELPSGRIGVIDSPDADITLAYIKNQIDPEVKELEFLVATHPHYDHIAGLKQIAEELPPREFWDGEVEHSSATYIGLKEFIEKSPDIRWVSPKAGTIYRQGDVVIDVLAPPANPLIDPHDSQSTFNNASLCLRLIHGRSAAILGADAQFNSWAYQMLHHCDDLRAQLLRVPHHGSNNGISYEVIRHIRPRVAILSVGPNSHGLPTAETVGFIEKVVGTKQLYRTDRDKNIVVESTGTGRFRVLSPV